MINILSIKEMKKAFLEGKKVYLRGLEEKDLDALHEWLHDSEVTKLLFQGDRPPSMQFLKNSFEDDRKKGNVVFAILDKETDSMIGWAGLYDFDWISRKAEIRFFLGEKKMWNRGYTTETVSLIIDYGFDKLNLHRIYGGTNEENVGSSSIFGKLGFMDEGKLVDDHFRNGRYYNSLRFGLLNPKEK